jgi:septal ring factor EnvC (AmiA/AmiB activator)
MDHQNRGATRLSQFDRIHQVLLRMQEWPEEGDERVFLKWLRDVALPRLSSSELLERLRADMDSLNEKTEVKMFVSNFARNFEKAMRDLDRQEADFARTKDELAGTKDELAAAKARWAREEQEKTRIEQQLAAAREEIERLKQGR